MYAKYLFLVLAVCVAWDTVLAQSLYNNATKVGLTGEGLRTRAHPGGGDYSEVQPGNGSVAYSFRIPQARAGEDFTVSGNDWKITRITVFGVQPTIHFPSVNKGSIEIRTGSVLGPVLAVGKVVSSQMTDIYRIFNNTPTDDYQVQRIVFGINAKLSPGHYWMTFDAGGIPNMDGPWGPFLTKVGELTVPGANAMVRVSGPYIGWEPMIDAGSLLPQDLPFYIDGYRLHSTGHSPTPTPFDIALSENFGILTK